MYCASKGRTDVYWLTACSIKNRKMRFLSTSSNLQLENFVVPDIENLNLQWDPGCLFPSLGDNLHRNYQWPGEYSYEEKRRTNSPLEVGLGTTCYDVSFQVPVSSKARLPHIQLLVHNNE